MTSSLLVFDRYIKRGEDGKLDVSLLLSKECYEEWLESRGENRPQSPEEAFRKCITGHCKPLLRPNLANVLSDVSF